VGRVLLVFRLAARDLRRRRTEAGLLLLAIVAATATLTLGLVLRGVTNHPYDSTRAATAGPDVVASVVSFAGEPADVAELEALADAPGVVGHGGPYPVTGATLEANGHTVQVDAEGRDVAPASIDQPKLTQGSWLEDGGVVLEAALADVLGVDAGDQITLNGRSFPVAGVAVTAATPPYPVSDHYTPMMGPGPAREVGAGGGDQVPAQPDGHGLVWLTQADVRSLAPQADSLAYVLHLKLADPDAAPAFVSAHTGPEPPMGTRKPGPRLVPWQEVLDQAANIVRNEQRALVTGGWLLGLLAAASVAVLVGGRMADQIRRVGLLKAVGGTPSLVAVVLLAEYLVLALIAAAAGLAIGWLTAPLLTDPSAGLLGSAASPSLTLSTIGVVTGVALGVAVVATFVPAVRAARISTVRALADSARPPRRTAWLIAISARLPVPLLLGLRVAARRPRRVVLGAVSIAITVSGIVAVLAAHAQLDANRFGGTSGLTDVRADRLNKVLLLITVMLVALAAVNAIFITWATVLDARRSSALARALGATPHEVSAGLSAAQVLPAIAGAVLGIPGGLGLIAAVSQDATTTPSFWSLLAVVPGTVLVVVALTTLPARVGARRPVAEVLQSEHA
jgi:ABC-type lipoprotein release transport system permease subunit